MWMLTRLVFAVAACAVPLGAWAQAWTDYATVSMTDAVTPKLSANRLCYSDGRDIACNDNSGGLLSTSSTIHATAFVGDGSGLTGVVASTGDRVVSGTTSLVAISNTGYISVTQSGYNTAYFHPTLGLVAVGVSSTGGISGTTGYFGGGVTATAVNISPFGSAASINGYRINGTPSSMTTVTDGNYLLTLSGGGYDGTSTVSGKAQIALAANGAWSGTAHGTMMLFRLTEVGGDTLSEAMRLVSYGNRMSNLVLNSPANNGLANLSVSGSAFITSWTMINATSFNRTATAPLEVSGTVSATRFVGDGSGLTGVAPVLTGGASGSLVYRDAAGALSVNSLVTVSQTGTGLGIFLGGDNPNTSPFTSLAPSRLETVGTGSTQQGAFSIRHVAMGGSRPIVAFKTSAGSAATPTDVAEGQIIGNFQFAPYINGNYRTSAEIMAVVDGTPGTSSYPGRLTFSTTASGSTTRAERLRITGNGLVGIGLITPTANLEVSGTVSATRFVGDGSGLTGVSGTSIDGLSDGIASGGLGSVYLGASSGGTGASTVTNTTALGFSTLAANTSGYANTAVGRSVLAANTSGYNNTGVGVYSLITNDTGSNNTAVGLSSLYGNTSGYGNTAIGVYSLVNNSTGYSNVGVGNSTLYTNADGYSNTAIGYGALLSNASGHDNAAVGNYTLYTSTASDNTAVGSGAAFSTSTGPSNVVIGKYALYYNATGGYNVVIGSNAGLGTTGGTISNSVLVGASAGGQLAGAQGNVMVGTNAGYNTTTGSYNLLVGNSVNAPAASTSSWMNLGNTITADMTNAAAAGGAAKVGINMGTTAPSVALHVSGSIVSKAYDNGSGTSIDWSQGNVQGTSASCGAFTFSNMIDGGSYTLTVEGTTAGTCSFSHTGLTFRMPSNHGATTNGTMTVYSFLRRGTNVFVTWTTGY